MPLSLSTRTVYLHATNAHSCFIDQRFSCYKWKLGRFRYQSLGRLKRDNDGAPFPPKTVSHRAPCPCCSLHTDCTMKDYCLNCKCTNLQKSWQTSSQPLWWFGNSNLVQSDLFSAIAQISQIPAVALVSSYRHNQLGWCPKIQTQHMTNRDSYWTVSSYRMCFCSDRL